MKTQLRMVKGDITQAEADAIVNSANNDLVLGGGVSGAIRRVAGAAVQDECHKIGTVPLGTAVVTSGGQLKAQWIIHAAVNPLGLWADPKSVRNATRAVLKKAEEKQVKRLAFPAIGTGAGALPVERCADILIDEVLRHCGGETTIEEVMFVLYDEKPFAIFEERFNQRMNPASAPPEGGASASAPSGGGATADKPAGKPLGSAPPAGAEAPKPAAPASPAPPPPPAPEPPASAPSDAGATAGQTETKPAEAPPPPAPAPPATGTPEPPPAT